MFWIGFLPAALTFLFYLPALRNGFFWDDEAFVQQNLQIRSLGADSLRWMLTGSISGNWVPLTFLSLALDYWIGGLQPWVYHLDNLFWHCLNTTLVFFLAKRVFEIARESPKMKGTRESSGWEIPGAFLAALLFGLHPLHVESVAWVVERKDVLFSFFYLSSLRFYLGYASADSAKNLKFWFSFALFIFSLLSKSMGVTLPFILLLLDYWPLQRRYSARVLLEKIPFFLVSLVAGFITLSAESQAGAMASENLMPPLFRVASAFHSTVFYIGKILFPANLAVFYPLPKDMDPWTVRNIISFLLVFSIFGTGFLYRKRFPAFWTSWIFFCLTLGPVLGLLQTGSQAEADRFTYIPSLGPFIFLGAVLSRWVSKKKRLVLPFLFFFTLLLATAMTRQLSLWSSPVLLWANAARVSPGGSGMVYTYLGDACRSVGRLRDALKAYDEAIQLNPDDFAPHGGKAVVLYQGKEPVESIQEFKTAMRMNPNYDLTYFNYWIVCQRLGMYKDSLQAAQHLRQLDSTSAQVYDLLGISYGDLGQFTQSVDSFQKALLIQPGNSEYLRHLAATQHKAKDSKVTMEIYQSELEGRIAVAP